MTEENKKTINQGIEYLRKIGVEKIKEDTHLDTIKITDILEKRFDKLDYVRAKGFIYILEKEYGIDLSDWLEEYHLAYPQIDDEEQQKREHYSNEIKQKKITFYLCVFGVCIVLVVTGRMFFGSNLSFWESKKPESTRDSAIKSLPKTPNLEASNQANTEMPTLKESERKIEEKKPEDRKFENKQVEIKKTEANKLELPILKPIDQLGSPVFEDTKFDPDSILYLEFLKPVWVGIIDFDSKKRIAKISKEFDISLDREILIYIAYGSFNVTLNEDEKEFKTYKPIFLTYSKEGGLREIAKEEFVILNGGIEW